MFEDWHAIHTLLMLYAERIDSADFAGAAALFEHGTYSVQGTDDFPLQPIAASRYHDRFEKVDGTWRFADRVFVSHLIGDLSAHVGGAGNRSGDPS
jgi:hypothetical protein